MGIVGAITEGLGDLGAEYLIAIPVIVGVAFVPFGARRLVAFAKSVIK